MNYQLTVIICATDLIQAYNVCKNIEVTSGCKCQFLIHNNKDNLSIAKVYNMYAKIAKADYILLAHQDIELIGNNWFNIISNKLNEHDCGAIGFAGSVIKPKDFYGGWSINTNLARCNYSHKTRDNVHYNRLSDNFDQVCVLDGLALFIKKTTLRENKFDEVMITGFHCYDIDFTLMLHINGYKNYVITDKKLTVFHKSIGKHNNAWIKDTFRLMTQKWNKYLPISIPNIKLSNDDIISINNENQMFIQKTMSLCNIEDQTLIINSLPFKLEENKNILNTYNNGYSSWN